jgi:hypothetical protein
MLLPLGSLALLSAVMMGTPLLAGAILYHRRGRPLAADKSGVDTADTAADAAAAADPASSMAGYVASESDVFFADDPLGACSLPELLAYPELSEAVMLDMMEDGSLSSRLVVPVSAGWEPWGYELCEDEASCAVQLELGFI